jgi:putative FmdB family regulatory protein
MVVTGGEAMPTYEYQASDERKSCDYCSRPFERIQRLSDPPLAACPECGAPVRKVFSVPSIGSSRSGLDQRAKQAGFTKFQRLGKGEYERKY